VPPTQAPAGTPGTGAGKAPAAGGGGGGGGGSAGDGPVLTLGMVDRLFWRAGFGPRQADRTTWTGRTVGEAVDWMLETPAGSTGPQATLGGAAIDRLAGANELVLDWVGRMVASSNPLVERMTFFWHRHWACSIESVDLLFMAQQNDMFRRYANVAVNPNADFRSLAYEVGEGPAMLRYLNGELNRRGRPNENYGRELMELFCLGVTDLAGNPNYTENDVKEIARALSGWTIDTATNPNQPRGVFSATRFDNTSKTFLGRTGNFNHRQAVDIVLAHPAHASFLARKLWSEFIVGAPSAGTLADLTSTYLSNGMRIRPLLRKILMHPQLFDSLEEPAMIKPPIVFVAGGFRQVGLNLNGYGVFNRLNEMGQLPLFPPNVSGWEYGPAFLTTNAALNRWGFGSDLVQRLAPADAGAAETPQAAVNRALTTTSQPWLASATRAAMLDYATRAPASSAGNRQARQRVLLAMALSGPDTHVM
jgi:uncharacterized protein (DUF1800 family)